MNKTFKLVFSKARNTLMVVNEATKSTQTKGCRTVIAAAVLSALMVSPALAIQDKDSGASIGAGENGFTVRSECIDVTAVQGGVLEVKADSYVSSGSYGAVTNNVGGVVTQVLIGGESLFENNTTNNAGAALAIFQAGKQGSGSTDNTITAAFEGNSSVKKGGAVASLLESTVKGINGSTTFVDSTFKKNTVTEGDGGAIYAERTSIIVNGGSFTENTAGQNGGAIHSYIGSLTVDGAIFQKNEAGKNGGAIMAWSDSNSGTIQQVFEVTGSRFEGNSAVAKGGAIAWLEMEANEQGEQFLSIENTEFISNSAAWGGAIYTDGKTVLNGQNRFEGNEATTHGGAIYVAPNVDASLVVENGTESIFTSFVGNTSEGQGGAIYNGGVSSIGDYTYFEGNKAAHGGAFTNNSSGTDKYGMTVGNHVSFVNNEASGQGGAIHNQRNDLEIGNDVLFVNNKTTGFAGGAIYSDTDGRASAVKIGDRAVFNGNSSAAAGGAIYQYATSSAEGAKLSIGEDAYFIGNDAASSGGAIASFAAETTVGANAVFTSNTSGTVGGAINNQTYGDVIANFTLGSGAVFSNNSASENGGAIYNTGNLLFKGNVTFSGNTAGGVLNDIHNTGTMTVEAGTLTLDGGITGNGTLTFADGSALSVKVGTSQADSTTIANTVTVGKDVTLTMSFVPGYVGEYSLVTDDGSVNGEFTLADNAVFDVTAVEGENGVYDVALKSTEEIAQNTGADANQAAAIGALMRSLGANEMFNDIATVVSNGIQSSDQAVQQAALDAVTAMSPEVAPMITQVQSDTATKVFGLIGHRLGGKAMGMASGDQASGTALWVEGLVGTTDLDETSKAKGYSADTTGMAMGLEAKPVDALTVGAGFAYADIEVDGFMRNTDIENMTAFLYGEYKPSNWYVNGIVSYAWADYDESKNVAGVGVDAKYDVDTFGMQLMTGLDLTVANVSVTPEAGLRYFHIGMDAYTDTAGMAVKATNEDILTGVLGARISTAIETSNAVRFVPEARVAMTYDFVDADNSSFVTLANGSSYSVEGETLDRFGVEAGVGVKAEMGDHLEMSLSYEGAWRGDYENHAGILNAKYKF